MKSELIINDIRIESSEFQLNPQFQQEQGSEIQIDTEYTVEFGIHSEDKRAAMVRLGCKINEDMFESSPFRLSVAFIGFFGTHEDAIEDYLLNATSILFPYLRTYVSTMTSAAGIQTVILPPVNVISLIAEAQKNAMED
ncbi:MULTISPECIES: protein-export chaperone SecB [Bacillus cereus group]|uniref:protein-export chaperone SecB n=1 Tax=Bacillus cereus group TaxID=86661 RepID=UPI00111CAD85|nr:MULTISPECIES: protein-export chaperone SecB [Bacillus cereus group]MDH8003245.1 protein-export chaperone SecB [Bacillus cereus]TNO99287.1 hypothetical protein FHY68_27980 [Bacillus pacificus]